MKKTKNKKVNVRKQLKIKLENSLTRHKNKTGYKPTPDQAYQWFRVINRGLFNSRLPIVEIQIKKLHKDWVLPKRKQIERNTDTFFIFILPNIMKHKSHYK